MSSIFFCTVASFTPDPFPVSRATSAPVTTAAMAAAGVVLPIPISPAARSFTPLFASSRAIRTPNITDSSACSRVMAGPCEKSSAPHITLPSMIHGYDTRAFTCPVFGSVITIDPLHGSKANIEGVISNNLILRVIQLYADHDPFFRAE